MRILTDELLVFKGPNTQSVTGAWKRCFVNDLLTLRPAESSAARCSEQTRDGSIPLFHSDTKNSEYLPISISILFQ